MMATSQQPFPFGKVMVIAVVSLLSQLWKATGTCRASWAT
jgi:hypothetical protein